MSFTFNGKTYNYFKHPYNKTWINERIVEVPIIWDIVEPIKGKILEVGNVLQHYFNINHTIIDLREKMAGVLNQDICTFKPNNTKYDLIVSISTLEHVGKEPKIIQAFDNLKSLLAPKGSLVFTIPTSWNPEMDVAVQKAFKITDLKALKRTTADNQWLEIPVTEVWKCKYNKPFRKANGLVICFYTNL